MTTGLFDGVPAQEPSAGHGFAGGKLDRRSENRDARTLAAALADPSARAYLLAGDTVLLRGGSAVCTLAEAEAAGAFALGEPLLLGWQGDQPRLAFALPAGAAPEGWAACGLRALAAEATLPGEHLGALALARSLAEWHRRHGFCAACGAATLPALAGYRRDCPACSAQHFPRTDPVAIMLAIDADRCLLGRGRAEGPWSCLAGFVEPGETIESAVRREVKEEAGIAIGRVRYHSSQPWPFPSQLMIGFHAEALSTGIARDERELSDCRWFVRDEVAAMLADRHPDGFKTPPPLAIAHHLIADWLHAE